VSLDIVCPIVLNILQWPSAALPNGKTANPFYGGVNSSGPSTNLIPSMIMTGFLPPLCGWISVGLEGAGFAVSDPWNEVGSPACQTGAGIANTVLSSIYGQGQGWNPVLITGGVVGNLSYDISLLGLPELAEATEDATAIAKLIIDAIGNYGAAIFYQAAAIDASVP
jgi:hypothetical protein